MLKNIFASLLRNPSRQASTVRFAATTQFAQSIKFRAAPQTTVTAQIRQKSIFISLWNKPIHDIATIQYHATFLAELHRQLTFPDKTSKITALHTLTNLIKDPRYQNEIMQMESIIKKISAENDPSTQVLATIILEHINSLTKQKAKERAAKDQKRNDENHYVLDDDYEYTNSKISNSKHATSTTKHINQEPSTSTSWHSIQQEVRYDDDPYDHTADHDSSADPD